ncbi:MAG: acyltransferase domain-containing protein [Armatimonadota bacterium]
MQRDSLSNAHDHLETVLTSLGIDDAPEIWYTSWDESQVKAANCVDHLAFSDYIDEAAGMLRLSQSAVDAFQTTCAIIFKQPELESLLRLWHYIIFHTKMDGNENLHEWPNPADMGSMSGMFPAAVLLSGLNHMLQIHGERCIPAQITIDTLSDVDIWMRDYCNKYGTWGLDKLSWLSNHFRGRLCRLGRLQFMPSSYNHKFNAYRNHNTKELLVLSHGGVIYRSDGLIDGTNGIFDSVGRWTSILDEQPNIIRGNSIDRLGYAKKEPLEIIPKEWELVLSPGSSILEIHIPAGDKLSHDECGKSFYKAMSFFPTYFPKKHFTGFTCESWLLDPQIQSVLTDNSNIVKFQKEFHLLPALSDDTQTFERVFNSKPDDDISNAPKDTTLRRALLNYMETGNRMRMGAGFILNQDLKWGSQIYQTPHK